VDRSKSEEEAEEQHRSWSHHELTILFSSFGVVVGVMGVVVTACIVYKSKHASSPTAGNKRDWLQQRLTGDGSVVGPGECDTSQHLRECVFVFVFVFLLLG
jgi:hypothetical protein